MKVTAVKANKQHQSRAATNNLSQKTIKDHGPPEFSDNQKGTITQNNLKFIINDSPRMINQRKQIDRIRGKDDGTVQRYVALAKDKVGDPDFVELTSIHYAKQRAGDPVELLKDADFSALGEDDVLFIVGHGAPGAIAAGKDPMDKTIWYDAQFIVNKLFHKTTGLKRKIKAIRFTSCYAGKGVKEDDSVDSIVGKIKSELETKKWYGVEVTGARGPSVKSDALGDEFTVIDPTKKFMKGLEEKSYAGEIQKLFEKMHEPRKRTKIEIQKQEIALSRTLTLEEKAKIASDETRTFYDNFVRTLKNPKGVARWLEDQQKIKKLSPEREELLNLLKAGPPKLTLDKPMLKVVSSEWCFLTTACTEAKGLPDDCHELETLRAFRDEYMKNLVNGEKLIAQYYEIAPKIVRCIKQQPNAKKILFNIYDRISESVKLIDAGENEKAMQTYYEMVSDLKERYCGET